MKPGVPSSVILTLAVLSASPATASALPPPLEALSEPCRMKDPRDCDCYTVNGPDPGYFQHYKLWDFRSVPLARQAHEDISELDDDALDQLAGGENEEDEDVNADDDNGDEDDDRSDRDGNDQSDALWFFETAFDKDWMSQRWQRPRTDEAPIPMVNSKHNIFFTRNRQVLHNFATYLVMRTTRHWNYTSTSEIETKVRSIFHCSLRVRLRVLPSNLYVSLPGDFHSHDNQSVAFHENASLKEAKPHPGACVGIFTYREHNCESDIEILTKDPPYRVHYANQPDYDAVKDAMIPGASTTADLPVHWTIWSTHRLDWLSDISRWWVDNKPQDAKTYRVPDLPSRLVVNLWSDGGAWTGDMRTGQSVLLAIDYIELAYNVSAGSSQHFNIRPSEQHGEHQIPATNVSIPDMDGWPDEFSEPDAEIIDGSSMKKKCKKGRKGRKCRQSRKKKKHGKKKRPPHRGPSVRCERVCNIDDLRFADGGLRR
ncbi:hypothetical protein F1880_002786 [Penicillium rolfsii]|nr:hypothetical protein F1880_002786 [Penicillium rolfsii]